MAATSAGKVCRYWQEYQSLSGLICYCEVEAFGKKLSAAELAEVGCTPERRRLCLKTMQVTVGYGRVPATTTVPTTSCDPPPQIVTTVVGAAEKKVAARGLALLVLGVLAGAYIALGAQLSTIATSDLAKYVGDGLTRVVAGLVFSLGLILVVVGGAELFTGNNLIITGVLERKVTPGQLLKNWTAVYLTNLLGALAVVLIMYGTGLWKANGGLVGLKAVSIANAKCSLTFGEAFFRGVMCNWLVCLAVWLAAAGRDAVSKILGIVFPIAAFVASGFEHSIANMYFIPMGILLKGAPALAPVLAQGFGLEAGVAPAAPPALAHLSWAGFGMNLLPVTLGNIVGGALFVGCAYWLAYARAGKPREAAAPAAQSRGAVVP
ncbi:MAG: formate/nitrite transporter family protein [Acetobacteraceae bacterium]|nr:formate/nitrite transporter family protein [Acetobacteraceae bacterium]